MSFLVEFHFSQESRYVKLNLMKVAWVSTWSRVCGIADYSHTLWTPIAAQLSKQAHEAQLVSLDEYASTASLVKRLQELSPDIIHFQHEYGIWGGKNPPLYRFPQVIKKVRAQVPGAKLVATAHTVIDQGYRFPVSGRGLTAPGRWVANQLMLKKLRSLWGEKTWGGLDAVVVHSSLQRLVIAASGIGRVAVIPHFVPVSGVRGSVAREVAQPKARERNHLLVFGFITPEKGQDIAIEAMSRLDSKFKLKITGSPRTRGDRKYLKYCESLVRKLKLENRVEISGYVEKRLMDSLYRDADLVIAPFRQTSGSGSLAQALGRGCAILASNLAINQEIGQRVPGALAYFHTEAPIDLATQVLRLFKEKGALESLKQGAKNYAEAYSQDRMAEEHVRLYQSMIKGLISS